MASSGSPAPAAMPTAAASHTVAAVVRPRTMSRRTKISPPPMNPMPETTWAAIRDGSTLTPAWSTRSPKPYLDTSMKTAEPSPTRVWVRSPALLARTSRSTPISALRKSARNAGSSSAPCPSVDQNGANGPVIMRFPRPPWSRSAPDLVRGLDDQRQLRDLLVPGERVAFDGGGEPALPGQRELLERHVLRGLVDA